MNFPFRKSRWYLITLLVTLIVCFILLWQLSAKVFTTSNVVSSEDYWRYWSAWHLTVRGLNPYDVTNLNNLLDQIPGLTKWPEFLPVILTPPWVILLITPFAPFTYSTSRMLWLLASIVILLICAHFLWRIYNGLKSYSWVVFLVTFTFFPTLLMLKQGQINPWALLGLVGFLYWTDQRRNDWLAGLSVALITIKPQILFLFWIALLFWIIEQHRWKILISCFLAILLSSLIVLFLNPGIFQQFINTYLFDSPVEWKTPTIGFYLRLWIGFEKFWLQFIAPVLAIIWFIFYWLRKHASWQWKINIIPLLWVSVLASPYSWTYDQVVLIIPVIAVTSGLLKQGWGKNTTIWLGIYWFINGITQLLHLKYTDEYFVWLAPALLIWYWLTSRSISDLIENRSQTI